MRSLIAPLIAGTLSCAACVAVDTTAHDIPFRFEKHQILLDANIRDAGPYTFLLDTGVTPSVVDIELARSLGLPLDEANAQAAGGAGADTVYIYPSRIEELALGGVAYGDVDAVVFPTAALSQHLGEPLHGILGDSFLNGRVVTIDYERRTVRIDGQAPAADAAGVYQFPLVTAPNDIMPLMEVRIDGRPIVVSMDTGSSFGVEVFASALGEAGLERAAADWETAEAAGARGTFEMRRGTLPQISVGPFTLDASPGVISAREDEHRQGNAGNALFQHFVVTLDYANRTVTLQRGLEP